MTITDHEFEVGDHSVIDEDHGCHNCGGLIRDHANVPDWVKRQLQGLSDVENERDMAFLQDVGDEVVRARQKFPSSNLVLAALTEELGELAQAMLKVAAGKWPEERIWEEAVQVAAVAMRVATEGDPSFDTNYTEPEEDEPKPGTMEFDVKYP